LWSDGRRLSFARRRHCGAIRIRGVRRTVSVTVQDYGLRQDLEGGKEATVSPKSKAASSHLDKVFTVLYQLIGIGILVEILRRLGAGFVAAEASSSGRGAPSAG
jgi:hypothetical protein